MFFVLLKCICESQIYLLFFIENFQPFCCMNVIFFAYQHHRNVLIIVAVVAAVVDQLVDRLVVVLGHVLHTWEAVRDPHIQVAGHWEEVQ